MVRIQPDMSRPGSGFCIRTLQGLVLPVFSLAMFALAVLAVPSSGAEVSEAEKTAAAGPRAALAKTLDGVVAVLSDPALDAAQRRERIELIAYASFDFETMSRAVLGKKWRSLSADQKVTFIGEFKQLLSRSYGRRLGRWGDEEIAIVGDRAESRGDVIVETRIVGGDFDGAAIDYRLRKAPDGEWRAIDVVVEGVRLVSTYRTQFRDAMAKGGAEDLLRQMKQKNAKAVVGAH